MGCVYARGDRLWIRFKGSDGKWTQVSTGLATGSEAHAHEMLDRVQRRIEAGRQHGVEQMGPLTVASYARQWIAKRREHGIREWTNDERWLRLHILPELGGIRLTEVRAGQLVDFFVALRKRGHLAPKSIYNIYSLLRAMFRDAEIRELVTKNPCILTRRELGKNVDADPKWRSTAIYTKPEIETLISHPKIPWDRRVFYALEALAALRLGEAIGVRWSEYHRHVAPLYGLHVIMSYDEEDTKEGPRHMPVHPTLAAILDEWWASGWESMMGRAPSLRDLIVPIPPEHIARRRSLRPSPEMRDKSKVFKRLRADLVSLGLRHRRSHDMRRTMISLARTDEARAEILERCTHNPEPKQRSIDVYSTFEWAPLCLEVAKLKIERIGPDEGLWGER